MASAPRSSTGDPRDRIEEQTSCSARTPRPHAAVSAWRRAPSAEPSTHLSPAVTNRGGSSFGCLSPSEAAMSNTGHVYRATKDRRRWRAAAAFLVSLLLGVAPASAAKSAKPAAPPAAGAEG